MSDHIRTYSELIKLPTFLERYEYCKIGNHVGEETFGSNRYLNQALYHLPNWKEFRNEMILRDFGCDFAMKDRPIAKSIILHHLNPLTVEDVLEMRDCCMDPENVVCVSLNTHNAIHYGDKSLLFFGINTRRPLDHCPWRNE